MAARFANTRPVSLPVQAVLLFVLLQIITACATQPPGIAISTPLPAVSCEVAWTGLSPDAYNYDFEQDVRLTSRGNEGYETFAGRVSRRECLKAWTVLVYMAADNEDMPPYAYRNLYEIEAAFAEAGRSAASTVYADVLVELDLDTPEGIRRLHLFSTPYPYELDITHEAFAQHSPLDIASPIVTFDEDESTPPAENLRQFVDWGIANYPAARYLVIVWGHGQGWRPRSLDSEPAGEIRYVEGESSGSTFGGIAFDHSQSTVLDIPSLRDALTSAESLLGDGRPLDIFVSDACLMQSLEVATELANVSRYLVGYEQVAPYSGLPYRDLLPLLNGSRERTLENSRCEVTDAGCRLAELLPTLYREAVDTGHYDDQAGTPVRETFTISTIATNPLQSALLPAMAELADALAAFLNEDPWRAIAVQELLKGDSVPAFRGGTRDIGILVANLHQLVEREIQLSEGPSATIRPLFDAIAGVQAALQATVLAREAGTQYSEAVSRAMGALGGLAVWVPRTPAGFDERIDVYARSRFYEILGTTEDRDIFRWRHWLELTFPPPPEADVGTDVAIPNFGQLVMSTQDYLPSELGRPGLDLLLGP